MAEKNCEDGDYLEAYSRFFNEFVARINPNDQLPVQASSRTVTEYELDGEIIHVALQYLDQKHCPPSLQGPLVRKIIEEVKAACKKQPEDCGYKPQERTYAPLKLMQAVTSKVNEVCTYYSDNSNLTSLPPPVSSLLPVISGAMKNCRRTMEDRHVILHDLNTIFSIQHNSPASYYAVFDGHAGHEAATYCATHLHQYLVESCFYPNDPERAFYDAFITTEKRLKEQSEKQEIKSGTTAVCALLINKKLYIAWAGDSKAELVTYDRYQSLVVPHLAENRDELMRLRNMGGMVVKGRVNGILSVTRAIGDFALKPYVTAEPEIECIDLDGTEDFLILGSDGFWDFVTIQETAGIIYCAVREGQDLTNLTKSLLPTGSSDNTTVIVVFLTPPSEIAARKNFTSPFLKSQEDLQPYLSQSRTNRYWLDEERVKLFESKARMELDRIDMMKVGEDDNKYLVNNPFYENGVRMEDDKDYCGNGRQKNMINIRNNDAQDWEEDEEDIKAICSDLPETDVDAFEPIWTSDVNQTPSSKDIYFVNKDGFSDQRLPHDQNQLHNLNKNENNDDDDDEDDEDYVENQSKKQENNEMIERENMHQQREQSEKEEEQQRGTNIMDDITPPSPHNTKSNQHALISESDNVGDSEDSEDEWNYYRIDPNKEEKECPPTALNETGEKKEIESDTPIESSNVNVEKDSSEKLDSVDYSKELGQCENPEYQYNFTTSEPEEQKEGLVKLDGDESVINLTSEDNLSKSAVDSPRVVSPSIEEHKREDAIEDMDFQLNPDAAEFVPVSPPSQPQASQRLIGAMNFHDFPISGSPMKQSPQAVVDNISLPSEKEFEEGARQRPNEIDEKGCSNGDGYISENDENLPPFTTPAGLDESVSEISSTKANFGDESSASILTVTDFHKTGLSMLDDSYTGSDRGEYDIARDPMAMSLTPGDFEAVLDEPKVDLNAVHDLTGPELDDDDNVTYNNENLNELETRVDSPEPEENNQTTVAEETSNPFVTSSEEQTVLEANVILDHLGEDNATLSQSTEEKLLQSPVEFSRPNESPLLQFDSQSCETKDNQDQFFQETGPDGQNLLSHSPEPITAMECPSSPQPSNADLAARNLISSMENLTLTDNANMVTEQVFSNQNDVVMSSSPQEIPEIKYDHQEYSSSYEPHEDFSQENLENPQDSHNVENMATKDLMSDGGAEEATGNLIEYDSCPSPQLEKDKVIDSPILSPTCNQKHEEELIEKQQLEEKADIVESSEDEFAKTERVCNLEAEFQTTPNAAANAANLSLNLSESVQEFTGLERELQPSPAIPEDTTSHEEKGSVEVCPKEDTTEVVEPQEKLSSPVTETISQEVEEPKVELESNKVEETKKESVVPETVAVAAVAAAAVAGAVSSSSITKTKPKTTATSSKSTKPGTTVTAKTVSHKSTTPTSPLKAVASSTTRTTSQSTVTKKPSTTANRPKQLDTANKPSSVSSTSKTVPSKTAAPPASKVSATKTSATTRPTSAPTKTRNTVSTAAKPSTGSSSSTQEKKQPTTNGDIKPLNKPATKSSTASRVSTVGSAATKTNLVKSSTTTRTSSTTGSVTSTIKSRVTSATGTTKSTTTKSTISNTTTSQRPKTAPVANSNATHLTAAKPKTTTTTKSPMIDKQIKETANKQISLAKTSPTKSPRAPISSAITKRVSSTNKSTTATSTPSPIKKFNSVQAKVSSKVSSPASTKTTTPSSTTPQVVQNGVSENMETVKNVIPENKEIEDDAPKKDLSPIVAPPDNQLIMSAD